MMKKVSIVKTTTASGSPDLSTFKPASTGFMFKPMTGTSLTTASSTKAFDKPLLYADKFKTESTTNVPSPENQNK